MQAFADGKVVQMWVPDHDPGAKVPGVWVDIKDPSFSIAENWRVKPGGPREWWAVIDVNTSLPIQFLNSNPGIDKVVYGHELVHVREVIE